MKNAAHPREKTVVDGSPESGGHQSAATPAHLPDVPPSDAGKTTAPDGGGTGGTGGDDAALERATAAAERTAREHGDGPGGGKSAGADGKNAGLANGSVAMEGEGLDADIEARLDELGPEMAVDTLNDGLEFVGELWSLKHLGDVDAARENAVLFRMSARRAERMQKFFQRLSRQHPEKARAWFARLLWSDPFFLVTDTVKKFQATAVAGAKLRAPASPPVPAVPGAPAVRGPNDLPEKKP